MTNVVLFAINKLRMINIKKPVFIASILTATLMALIIVFVIIKTYGYDSQDTNKSSISAQTSSSQYLSMVNKVRASAGVPALKSDPTLDVTAKIKAEDMIKKGYYEHNAPDGSQWYDLIRKNRSQNSELGENLAECASSPEEEIDALTKSPGHFKTMTDKVFIYFGSFETINPKDGCRVVVHQFSS